MCVCGHKSGESVHPCHTAGCEQPGVDRSGRCWILENEPIPKVTTRELRQWLCDSCWMLPAHTMVITVATCAKAQGSTSEQVPEKAEG